MGCGFGALSVENHDQVFSNGFERSDLLTCPSPLMVVMRLLVDWRRKRCRARLRLGVREPKLSGIFEHLLQSP
jgi:hypothetical protein